MSSSWKSLVTELEKLTADAPKAAWRTAQIVRQLLLDDEFLSEACDDKPAIRDSRLAKYSGRFMVSAFELSQMIEHFPKWEDWQNGRLDLLRDKTARAVNAANYRRTLLTPLKVQHPELTRRPVAAPVESLPVRPKRDDSTTEIPPPPQSAQERVAELEIENARLRKALVRAEKKIQALQRQLEEAACTA